MDLLPIVRMGLHQRQEEITVKQDPIQIRALHNVIPSVLLRETRAMQEALRNQIITHRIAGITFRTDANTPLSYLKRGVFARFVCEGAEPDVRQHFHETIFTSKVVAPSVTESNEQENHPLQPLPWRSKLLTILNQVEQIEVTAEKYRAIIRNFSQCELDFFYTTNKSQTNNAKDGFSGSGFSFAPTLRQIFSAFLPAFSSALVHSSGVIRNNLTALFLARSTGGKTTVTQTLNSDYVLSDDQIILRAEENVIVAHGTPFGRVTNGPASAKLGGLFLLEKAQQFELAVIKPLDMLEYLWTDQLIYTYFLPMDLRIKAYQMLYTACHQVPCYIMRFPKDHVDWDAIDLVMTK